jgi:hypothetical protein
MKFKVQVVIQANDGSEVVKDILDLSRENITIANIDLTLQESKQITAGIQQELVKNQVESLLESERLCTLCKKLRNIKGYLTINYRTLFGRISIKSPRLNHCTCSNEKDKSFSPLASILLERVSPELQYLETKWASLMSYGMTAKLLEDVLPIQTSISSICNNVAKVSERIERELGKEKFNYIEGCPAQWGNLSKPEKPITVGIDGGYVHAREGKNRKAGWFEVIVGKSMQDEKDNKRFGYVSTYDTKPKRRLYDMLINQGMQMNQKIIFLSDGGENVRDLQQYLSPQAEHILDWFHITMRITVMLNMVKSIRNDDQKIVKPMLEKIKWYLWHGNVFKALEFLEQIFDEVEANSANLTEKEIKFWDYAHEFDAYITANQNLVVSYSDRYYYGEIVSTGFVESTVNELISKRMAKKQQMRWTKKGAHLLLQARVKTLNNELKDHFYKWYPDMAPLNDEVIRIAA